MTGAHARPHPNVAPPSPASPRAASRPTSSTACCAGSGRSTSSSSSSDLGALPERDRALVRDHRRDRAAPARHAAASARALLERGLPREAPRVEAVLLIGAAQILFLDVPDHAAVDLSVRLAQADRHASRYSGLVNAVLRRLARDGKASSPRSTPCCSTRRNG